MRCGRGPDLLAHFHHDAQGEAATAVSWAGTSDARTTLERGFPFTATPAVVAGNASTAPDSGDDKNHCWRSDKIRIAPSDGRRHSAGRESANPAEHGRTAIASSESRPQRYTADSFNHGPKCSRTQPRHENHEATAIVPRPHFSHQPVGDPAFGAGRRGVAGNGRAADPGGGSGAVAARADGVSQGRFHGSHALESYR